MPNTAVFNIIKEFNDALENRTNAEKEEELKGKANGVARTIHKSKVTTEEINKIISSYLKKSPHKFPETVNAIDLKHEVDDETNPSAASVSTDKIGMNSAVPIKRKTNQNAPEQQVKFDDQNRPGNQKLMPPIKNMIKSVSSFFNGI